MANYKKQHFVPQFYLKNFTRDNMFSILSTRGELINNASYKTQCYSNYFYQDISIETALSKIEATVAPIIRRLIIEEDVDFSVEDENALRIFSVYQYFRTSRTVDIMCKSYAGIEFEINKLSDSDGATLKELETSIKDKQGKMLPVLALKAATAIAPMVSDLAIAMVRFSKKHSLISSDNPVLLFNNYYKQNIGFQIAGLIILLPISPNKAIVFYDSKLYSMNENYGTLIESKYSDSLSLNTMQLYNANSIIYGDNLDVLVRMREKLNSVNQKKEQLDMQLISALGDKANKLLVQQMPWLPINTDMSFLRLIPEAQLIPIKNRDFFAREPDEGWIYRLRSLEFLPKVIKSASLEKGMRDYNSHIELVKKYWNL